jgi:hypothetical protein
MRGRAAASAGDPSAVTKLAANWLGMLPAAFRAEARIMKQNVVLAERTARFGLGMLLLASPLLELKTFPFNLLGIVLIATAALGYCPLYAVLFSLRPKRTPAHEALQAHHPAH